METLRSVNRGMEPGQLMMDAYLHVPIHVPHQKYLRFTFTNQQFPFGLSSAPQVFTKLMVVAAATLRLQGVSVNP